MQYSDLIYALAIALSCVTSAYSIDTISLKNLEVKKKGLIKELHDLHAEAATAKKQGKKLGKDHQKAVLDKTEELQKTITQEASITGQPTLSKPIALKKQG